MSFLLPLQASTGYPRTYASFLDCLQNIQKFDIDEESQGDEVHQPHFDESMRDDENRSWFRYVCIRVRN